MRPTTPGVRRTPIALIVALGIGCTPLVGCGGASKATSTVASTPSGARSTAAGSSGSATTGAGQGSNSSAGSGPSERGQSKTTNGSSTRSAPTTGTPTPSRPISANAVAACRAAVAKRKGLSASLKAAAEAQCERAVSGLHFNFSPKKLHLNLKNVERAVCIRLVDSRNLSPSAKAQAIAHCASL